VARFGQRAAPFEGQHGLDLWLWWNDCVELST
jgi:hypothetical protein